MSKLRILAGSIAIASLAACQRQQPVDEHMAHMSPGDVALPTASPSNQQGDLSLPASARTVAARLAASPRHGEWITVPYEPGSKDSLIAWVVYPKTSNAKTPVVVVVHEIFGLSTWVRGVADQVAAEGFIAVAPDLLSKLRGKPSADSLTTDSAGKLARIATIADRNQGIAAVAKWAMSQPSAAPRYAVIGYCWGGTTTWMQTINGGTNGYSGGVAFYGTPQAAPGALKDSLEKIRTPIMLLSGSKDARIGAAMPGIDSTMNALKKWYYGKNYEGAIHGFLRAQDDPRAPRQTANQSETQADVDAERQANLAATKDAWPRTVEFLKKNLGAK
ncbi:MAG TPA: dienelactone hydrolase family protein [Gemmatimonadaceae bacterium]|jgi:carboxymethylenebutenolidase|nr:dienelactone hydrolase family protein [Gemmatimonadaceae bacterium]